MITEAATAAFDSIELDCGATLAPVEVAYETYGELNAGKTNAILVAHAFSGDAHAAGELGWSSEWRKGAAPQVRARSILKPDARGPCRFRSSRWLTWCGCKRS